MIFHNLRSIRSIRSNDRPVKDKAMLASDDIIEWDGEGGFNVSIQCRSCGKSRKDRSDNGRFRRKINLCRSGEKSKSHKYAAGIDNLGQKNVCRESEATCPADEPYDAMYGRITMSTHSSSLDIRREAARYVLTSLLSYDDAVIGKCQVEEADDTNQTQHKNIQHTSDTRLMLSTAEVGNVKRSLSYDDTIFDGLIEEQPYPAQEFVQNDMLHDVPCVPTDIATIKQYWPIIDMDVCMSPLIKRAYQFTPVNHVISWQDTVVLSALSY
jgi:hypothetical protein